MVRALFDERGALRALGFLGSVESLAPAIAPIIGVWLLARFGWQGSFWITALLAALLSLVMLLLRRRLPAVQGRRARNAYLLLLRNPGFQREALSQGCALASLLVFVFAMPTVFVVSLQGSLSDFITMQLIGISCFIVAANLSSRAVGRFGAQAVIRGGTLLALAGAAGLALYGLFGGARPLLIWLLFVPLNAGFGLRGPPAFFHALEASQGDDGRASALIILYTMLLTAAGTALIAPLIGYGLLPAAAAATLFGIVALVLLSRPQALSSR
jgi:MFS family permease